MSAHRLGLAVVLLAAGALRFARPDAWPVFCDEDMYARAVAEMAAAGPASWLRHPARDYVKPPLAFVLALPLAEAAGDPVRGWRLLSGLAGLVSTVGCALLGRRLGGPAAGLWAGALYATSPAALVTERMGLLDALLGALVAGSLLAAGTALERGSWRWAMGAAVAGAAAVLTKPSGVAAVAAPFLLWLALRPPTRRLAQAAVAAAGPVLAAAVLVLGPLGPDLAQQTTERLEPFAHLRVNLLHLSDAVAAYLPWGVAGCVAGGLAYALRRDAREGLACALWLAAWTVPWLTLSNFAPWRYVLPAVPLALALAGVALAEAWSAGTRPPIRHALRVLVLVAAGGSAAAGVHLVADHRQARLSALDDWQYRSGWPSGYGFREARRFVAERARSGSEVACLLSPVHRTAAGCDVPVAPGVRHHGFFDLRSRAVVEAFPPSHTGELLVITDGGMADGLEAEERIGALLKRLPRARVLRRFPRPGAITGPVVLRLPPPP